MHPPYGPPGPALPDPPRSTLPLPPRTRGSFEGSFEVNDVNFFVNGALTVRHGPQQLGLAECAERLNNQLRYPEYLQHSCTVVVGSNGVGIRFEALQRGFTGPWGLGPRRSRPTVIVRNHNSNHSQHT